MRKAAVRGHQPRTPGPPSRLSPSLFWEGDDVFYGHVLGFKGLERPAVILAVNGFREEARARDLLVVCGDLDLIRRVGGEGVVQRLLRAEGAR